MNNTSAKGEIYCPIEAGHVTEMKGKRCPCGWPKQPCINYHKYLRSGITLYYPATSTEATRYG